MRSEGDGVVTYRAEYTRKLVLWSIGLVGAVLVVAVIVGPDLGSRLLPAVFLVLWLAAGWSVGLRPRVELHPSHVRVLTPGRDVTLRYDELRTPEFSGGHLNTGPLLELVGRFERVTVWPGGGGSPPQWQLDLHRELLERIEQTATS